MKLIKIYETAINLSAVEMYQGVDLVVSEKIQKYFVGKCEKNSFIINFLGIEKISHCRMNKNLLDGSGQVSVQFKAEAIVYNDDDILTGCEVQQIVKGNKIICKYENAIINIKGNKNLQSLKSNQKLTIKVITVSYLKGKDKITIYGIPYSYSYKFNIFLTNSDKKEISGENMEIINAKISDIQEEIKLISEINKKTYEFFNEMYYPFTQNKNISSEPGFEIISILDFVKKLDNTSKKIILIRHPVIDKSTPNIMLYQKDVDLNSKYFNTKYFEFKLITESLDFVILNILNDYLSHIKAIKEMCSVYPTDMDIENHNNIWNIYRRLKVNLNTINT